MLNKFPNTAKSLVWILIVLLSVVGTLANNTICMEEDGQVNMEIVCECPFENSENQTSHRSLTTVFVPAQTTSVDQCSPCIDISFSLKSDIPFIRTQLKAFDINSLVTFSSPHYLATLVNTNNNEISFYPSHVNNYYLSSLSTVVLLI